MALAVRKQMKVTLRINSSFQGFNPIDPEWWRMLRMEKDDFYIAMLKIGKAHTEEGVSYEEMKG
jgi:hypothetical protein